MRRVLESAGAVYVAVPVYRAVADVVGERAATGEFAAVVVGSPNLARRAASLFPARPPAVAIGRTTASALRDAGWPPAAVAATPTPADVAEALKRALRRET
jgi:uroporphyrinogen-III synthase